MKEKLLSKLRKHYVEAYSTDCERLADAITTTISRLSIDDSSAYSTTELVIAKAFEAGVWYERTFDEWVRIGNALDDDYLDAMGDDRVRLAFRRMVRDGFLYSKTATRQHKRVRVYGLKLDLTKKMPRVNTTRVAS